MTTLNYPLIYYQLNEEAVLGLLVGTDYQLVEKDLKSLKTSLLNFLQRRYKKEDDYPYMDILEPKLKIFSIKIRPAYRDRTGRYPMNTTLDIPVAVVFGDTGRGYYECYLPAFNESFYYYDPKQFRSLVQHFATDILNRLTPEQLHRQLIRVEPQLDVVPLRINEDRKYRKSEVTYTRKLKVLSRLTSVFPTPKAQKKKARTLPEGAWELEDRVIEIIEKIRSNKANVLIVGEHGVGKTAALSQAIRKITGNKGNTSGFSFWQLMPQRITASSKYLGEWQETCEEMVEELRSVGGVLWVLDMVRMIQVGGEGAEDSVAAFLLNFMQSGILKVVGEVTEQELESMRRLLPGFVESFQIVKIEELPEPKVQKVMDHFAEYISKNLKIAIPPTSMALMYRLLLRYYPYERFPGKAIKFLGRCVSEAQLNEQNQIGKKEVIENFVKQTGLPELFLRDDLLLDIEDLKNHFNQNIIGQPAAVEKLCGIVKVFKAGLNNPYKPIQTLLFAGPTGVGKTASAKCLADYFFGKGQKQTPLIRIDMSEFQHPSQITRFIGAGNEVGKLVKDIRERPFSVLLLDEVEKADASIFDALMTVLDEGLLVDSFGRITNFRNTIIIMTSNLGATNQKSIGFGSDEGAAKYLSAINRFFRPEFVNRIDGIVYFNLLTPKDIKAICRKELIALNEREGLEKRGLSIQFSSDLVDYLAKVGFHEKYGARPLQRTLEQEVVGPMGVWLLENPKIENGTLDLDYNKKLIINFKKEKV